MRVQTGKLRPEFIASPHLWNRAKRLRQRSANRIAARLFVGGDVASAAESTGGRCIFPQPGRKIPSATAFHPCHGCACRHTVPASMRLLSWRPLRTVTERTGRGEIYPRGTFFEGAPHPDDCDVIAGADTGANRAQRARGESSACFWKQDRREPCDSPHLTQAN